MSRGTRPACTTGSNRPAWASGMCVGQNSSPECRSQSRIVHKSQSLGRAHSFASRTVARLLLFWFSNRRRLLHTSNNLQNLLCRFASNDLFPSVCCGRSLPRLWTRRPRFVVLFQLFLSTAVAVVIGLRSQSRRCGISCSISSVDWRELENILTTPPHFCTYFAAGFVVSVVYSLTLVRL